VRIVAGTARGRRIVAPEGRTTRPTLDRVRQAIFNALEARDFVRDAVVLDLFGGSGALGLEALSRGATSVTLVETDRAAVNVARDNAIGLDFGSQVRIIRSDVTRWLDGGGATALQPTLVLADPPYEWSQWPQLFAALPASVACAVVETGGPLADIVGWEVLRAQRYGGTVVTMLTPAPARQPAEQPQSAEEAEA
jgi:16S rRNA (guanine966-N2)-methyltransferase